MTRRRSSASPIICFVVALVALLFVDGFKAPGNPGWNDLGQAPHLAATVQRSARQAPPVGSSTKPFAAIPPAPFWLSLDLFLLGVVAAGSRWLPRHTSRTRPPARGPPVALV